MAIFKKTKRVFGLLLAASLSVNVLAAGAQTTSPVGDLGGGAALLPTGQIITPTAPPGSIFAPLSTGLRTDGNADANGAVSTALSPDGKTLLILTSGYNRSFSNETTGEPLLYPVLNPVTGAPGVDAEGVPVETTNAEWVFVVDLSGTNPVKKQQINIPNTYSGLTWSPDGHGFYVSGGIDDRVYRYRYNGTSYVPDVPFILLGHNSEQTAPFPVYDGGLLKGTPAEAANTGAVVAGITVSRDGKTLLAANFENDSLSIVDTNTRAVLREVKFFTPGSTVATGEFPYDVAVKSDSTGAASKAFVTSQRDDEVLAVDVASGTVLARIPVGSQPNKTLLSPDQSRLYVANGNSDTVSVIDTTSNAVVRTISLSRPGDKFKGANPNSLALGPGGQLYVTLGGENAVAVVNLVTGQVIGRIPTGWYPNSVSVSADGTKLYVVNAKDNIGPNPFNSLTPEGVAAANTTFRNDYTWALEKGGISIIPVPDRKTLAILTQQVNRNNGFQNRVPDPLMAFLRTKIKHVIYIVKENRTYDQVLGDLPVGNGDPTLTLFPEPISPNHHRLASEFVTLDNFYDSGESSGVGWNWSTYARTTDYTEKQQSVLYGNARFSGLTYDYEGLNRNINLANPQTPADPNSASLLTTRATGVLDPSGNSSILPGTKDVNAPLGDGELEPEDIGGYLWDSVLRAGKTVRNYGFYTDGFYSTSEADATKPDPANPYYIPVSPTPFASNIPQSAAAKTALEGKTDIYFRGYDQKNADIYLFNEWNREFQGHVTNNNLPNLSLVRLPHDHFGDFEQAVAGLDTPETQMADNDYAVGKLVETVSKSIYWKDTAIVIVEDDSQNGPDHIDGHRSVGYIISPYTKRGAVVSSNYNTVNLLRTMEDLLGVEYLGLNDANAKPMSDVFTRTPNFATYTATVPGILCAEPVDPNLVPACSDSNAVISAAVQPLRDGKWWAKATQGFNFAIEDKLETEVFNRLLWTGIKGDKAAYPGVRDRRDLSTNRTPLLKQATPTVKK